MLMSAAVNCAPCHRATLRASCACVSRSTFVANTLTTVAAKRIAFARQGTDAVEGVVGARLLEGVAEGGGESVESGSEAGIDGSYVGVEPELSPGEGGIFADIGRPRRVEPAVPERLAQRLGVRGVGVDRRAPRATGFFEDPARQVGDAGGLERERYAEEPLGQRDGHGHHPIGVSLDALELLRAKRQPAGGQ